ERRRPWDATIQQDLGIDREALNRALFEPRATQGSPYHAAACGRRDIRDVLAQILPTLGYTGSVDAFLRYWFEHDAVINADVLAAVQQLRRHAHVELYL